MAEAMNRIRGHVPLMLEDRPHTLRLTLGALAEIETALGTDDLTALTKRLANPSASDLLVILAALLRGGGHDLPVETLRAMPLDLKEVMRAVSRAFALGLGRDAEGETPGKPRAQGASPSHPTGKSGAGPGSA